MIAKIRKNTRNKQKTYLGFVMSIKILKNLQKIATKIDITILLKNKHIPIMSKFQIFEIEVREKLKLKTKIKL